MKNVLVTGASSGVGWELSKLLVKNGYRTWGIARNQKLLKQLENEIDNPKFTYKSIDLSINNPWKLLVKSLTKSKFIPDVVVFNAAINKNDLIEGIDSNLLEEMFRVNFFSIISGVEILIDEFSKPIHFITISSTSSFKGNYREGIGYSASKAALSVAFESLYQKYYLTKYLFTTIYFGPIKTRMMPFTRPTPLILTAEQAAECIIKAIKEKKSFYYYPKVVFFILSMLRLLPKTIYFKLWNTMQKSYLN